MFDFKSIRERNSRLRVHALSLIISFALLAIPMNGSVYGANDSPNYLHTSGNRILDASDSVVGLSGVNWFGFETQNRAPHGLWTRNWQDVLNQVRALGYNVIRLPFSNAMLEPHAKPAGINYQKNPDLIDLTALEVMDRIVAGAGARDIRVILDNHRSTAGGGPESNGLWYTAAYPESRWIADWKMLARRYKGNDTVVGMDLRNEPFNACWGCNDPSKDWRLAAEKAGNAILSVNPDLLIIVEGVATYNGQSTWWGGNLMGAKDFPVRLRVANRLVYSPHEYPASIYPQSWFSDPDYPNNLPAVWDKYWGYMAEDTPILIGEFGSRLETEKDRQWFRAFQNYIRSKQLHWTFWSLNPNAGDTGGLLRDDWLSVHQEKQNLLKRIQYPLIESDSQPHLPITKPTLTIPPRTMPTPRIRASQVLDDFESGNLRSWKAFRATNSSATASRASPGQAGTYALKIDYRIGAGGWAGAERIFAASQDWSDYAAIGFSFFGTNSGVTIRFEILNNRAPGRGGDTAERFEYKFVDNFNGWKTFSPPWSLFARRSDWQPEGAPDDGFHLTSVWGFNIAPLDGQGSFRVDNIRLVNP